MEFELVWELLSYGIEPFFSQVHPLFKDKTAVQTEKSLGKTKGRNQNQSSRGKTRPPQPWLPPRSDHGSHQGPW